MENQNQEKTNQLSIDNRPKTLDNFIGNETIKKQINSWIKKKSFPKSILLYGNSGCGKTTLANIIANEISKLDNVKIEELDCGQYSKADIQEFVAKCSSGKTLLCNRKVFILNETQELSKAALKALLVLLEKEDNSTYYILTTMEDSKISSAIKNRCSCLKVKPLQIKELGLLLNDYLKNIKVNNKEDIKNIAQEITQASNGVPRNAIQMINQYLDSEDLSKDDIQNIGENFGGGESVTEISDLIVLVLKKDLKAIDLISKIDWNSNWDLYTSNMVKLYYLFNFNFYLDQNQFAQFKLKELLSEVVDNKELLKNQLNKHINRIKQMRLIPYISNTIIYEYFIDLLS